MSTRLVQVRWLSVIFRISFENTGSLRRNLQHQFWKKKFFKRFKFDCIHHTTAESCSRCWLVYLHNSNLNLCHSMLNLVTAGCYRYLLATWLNSILQSSKRIYRLLICRVKSSFSEKKNRFLTFMHKAHIRTKNILWCRANFLECIFRDLNYFALFQNL